MAKLVAWRDVVVGTVVDLGGQPYEVTKIKTKGKATTVSVRGPKGVFTREVKSKAEVATMRTDLGKIARKLMAQDDKLRDETGAQRRWATEAEAREKPHKATGGDWATPKDGAEAVIVEELAGARLVGEAESEDAGYYVPRVDVSTVASHLLIFHDIVLESGTPNEWLARHEREHEKARTEPFTPPHIVHWHTKERP